MSGSLYGILNALRIASDSLSWERVLPFCADELMGILRRTRVHGVARNNDGPGELPAGRSIMSEILARIAAIYNPTTKKYATELIRAARAEGLLPEGKVAEQVAQLLDAARRARQRQGPNYISASKWEGTLQ